MNAITQQEAITKVRKLQDNELDAVSGGYWSDMDMGNPSYGPWGPIDYFLYGFYSTCGCNAG